MDTQQLAMLCIPFAGMLGSIALFPVLKAEWWEKHQAMVSFLWAALFLIPYTVLGGARLASEAVAEVIFGDYLAFITLLFGLYCVCGNITVRTNLDGSPRFNVLLLLVGSLAASWIGTTGASMILIRPLIRGNRWRANNVQTFVFFIFLVSNMGGVLTPMGDPPLLMGFMRHIPFFWGLHATPVLLLNLAILLTVYYFLDRKAYTRDLKAGLHPDIVLGGSIIQIRGKHNGIFLIVIIIAVVLSGALPNLGILTGSITIQGDVKMPYTTILEILVILLVSYLAYRTTDRDVREENEFEWGPIKEVAVLFIGIFITMVPALELLQQHGQDMGLTHPWQLFWSTGILSSFLDNTPTYLVFLTACGSMGATSGVATSVGIIGTKMLMAISCGAVFMGANTYIGNAPNFMVKAISESQGVKMPSFFGYMFWAFKYLVPVFLIDTLLFFLG